MSHCENSDTQINQTLCALDADFTLLMSATPGVNTIGNYEGYFNLIRPRRPPTGSHGQRITRAESVSHNPYETDSPDDLLLRINPVLLKKYIFECRNPEVTAVNLRRAAAVCMVRRTYASRINCQVIGAELPKLYRMDLEVEYAEAEQALHDTYAEEHLQGLFTPLKDGLIGMNMGKVRNLILIATWIGYQYVGDMMRASEIPDLKREDDWMHRILTVLKRKREQNGEVVGWTVPDRTDKLLQTAIITKESPKLQALLASCSDDVVRDKKEVIIFVSMPAQQFLVTEILNYAGIKAKMLSADLTVAERTELVSQFTDTEGSPGFGVDIQCLSLRFESSSPMLHCITLGCSLESRYA